MRLTPHKKRYVLKKAEEVIDATSRTYVYECTSYKNMTIYPRFGHDEPLDEVGIKVERGTYDKVIVKKDEKEIEIEYEKELKPYFDNILRKIELKVLEIDNKKFREFFPDYSDADERDAKLEEILGIEETESEEEEQKELTFLQKIKKTWQGI